MLTRWIQRARADFASRAQTWTQSLRAAARSDWKRVSGDDDLPLIDIIGLVLFVIILLLLSPHD